ncbi:hypothetical protein [Streptococcus uberis]|uniref:hypothetical protein n=1 Tax=Streptococcus uberis TaxID=1349 RepID=UPI001FF4F997|nr:hypothetical protein [Streptococcus uberis]MCK1226171.1 hypothetical protein [Streptococcus uberis]
MEIKDRLRVKLILYCLIEIREFVLSQYTSELMEKINKKLGDRDGHGMLLLTLRNLLPFYESISSIVDDVLNELVNDARHVNNSKDLFVFADETIPNYINRLRYLILEE